MITKLRLVKKNVKLLWVMRRDFQVVNDEGSSGKNLTPHPKKWGRVPEFRFQSCFQKFSRENYFFSLGKNFSKNKKRLKIKLEPGTGTRPPQKKLKYFLIHRTIEHIIILSLKFCLTT